MSEFAGREGLRIPRHWTMRCWMLGMMLPGGRQRMWEDCARQTVIALGGRDAAPLERAAESWAEHVSTRTLKEAAGDLCGRYGDLIRSAARTELARRMMEGEPSTARFPTLAESQANTRRMERELAEIKAELARREAAGL